MTQTMFGKDGSVKKRDEDGLTPRHRRLKSEMEIELRLREVIRAVCPWCLHISTLDKFTNVGQLFKIMKMFQCPECGQRMKDEKTLKIVDIGAEHYSDWFWSQIYSYKGYKRANWDLISARVREMDFATIFWNVQKKMKAARGG
jgi:hypothetical protein